MTYGSGGDYPPPAGQQWGGAEGLPPNYPGYPQQPPTPRRRKSPWLWILGLTAVVVVMVVVITVVTKTVASKNDDDAQAQQSTIVIYEVTGAVGTVELSYRDSERQARPATVPLPWRKEVILHGADAYFDVSARTADGSDQELACRVTANGQTIAEERTVSGLIGCVGRLNEH
ncbi:MmpS family transport accessory protein [Mycobacterium sp. E802]|uniref:MmpS family transport accessory protein n=1 Tax=Mycobacterium sp. E802 TaxID=1834152 RepID=UPI000A6C1A7F|nr:MmpS family transport accessory protein [Mycobacterium sp. E802]